jgi:hypothetical protein
MFSMGNFSPSSRLFWAWTLTLFAAAAVWPIEVWAQTLGDVICSANQNLAPFAHIYSGIAYIVAAILAIKGVMLLVKHASGNESQVVKAVAHLVGAGALGALPFFVSELQASLHIAVGAGGGACKSGNSGGKAADLSTMITQFVQNIYNPMFSLVSGISYIVGLFLIVRGLIKGAKTGSDPREAAPHAVAANLVVGAILVSIGGMLPTMMQTLFGSPTPSSSAQQFAISYTSNLAGAGVDASGAASTIAAILQFVQIIGVIGFLRGWLILRKAVEGGGQATVPQGLSHIIGGTMAINIVGMLTLIDTTFGTGILQSAQSTGGQ